MKSSLPLRFCWTFAFLFASVHANSEILHGVRPMDTLGEIKLRFPNATFERVRAAWVTENEAFFAMSGEGFPGTLRIAFDDERAMARKYIAERCLTDDSTADMRCKLRKATAARSDDEELSVNWVRWVPSQPIPIARYISKYGEPSRYDFDSATMAPTAYWERVALQAALSDDKKLVEFVTTNFSRLEQREAWNRRFGFIPDNLKAENDGPTAPKLAPKAITK